MQNDTVLTRCNSCGEMLYRDYGQYTKDFLMVKKDWGFFSGNDGITHQFCICEKCYRKMIKQFLVPVTETETTELL